MYCPLTASYNKIVITLKLIKLERGYDALY